MRKFFFFTMLLFIGVALDLCAQSTILDNKLQFASSESSLPEGWDFVNCSLVESSGKWFVQVNEGGSVTTPALTGLTGNANVIMLIYLTSDSYELNVSVDGAGEFDRATSVYAKDGWRRAVPYLLRGGNSETKVCFSGYNFRICNVSVTDIGDAVYYESFDGCEGTGGNDGSTSVPEFLMKDKFFDNPCSASFYDGLKAGDRCVYFLDDSDDEDGKYFRTPAIQPSETGSFIIEFRVLSAYSSCKMKVSFKDTDSKTCSYSLKPSETGVWKTFRITQPSLSLSDGFCFMGSKIFFDELLVREVKNLSLDENSESASLPSSQLNKTVFAQLTRTFQSGIWSTCCLPFQFSASLLKTATGDDGLEVSLRKLSSISSDGVFTFASADVIPAGEPFLLKVSKTVSNPEFRNVVMKTLEPGSATSLLAPGYAFTGCYGKTTLNTDGTHVFIGTDGELHRPSSTGNTMRGMRAYFVLPSYEAARGIAFDERLTGIHQLMSPSSSADVLHNLSGQRVKHPTSGLYIKNGKKIILNHK